MWSSDLLGPDFRSLPLEVPGRGAHTRTVLIRHRPDDDAPAPRGSVLYLHGWSDYVANAQLLRALTAAGWSAWGLDLHGSGRTLTDEVLASGAVPAYMEDVREYAPDLRAAVEVMRAEGAPVDDGRLVISAHSTGGLIAGVLAASWAVAPTGENAPDLAAPLPGGRARAELGPAPWRGRLAGLALSTPWLASSVHPGVDAVLRRLVDRLPMRRWERPVPLRTDSNCFRALSATRDGEWEIIEPWRPERAFPLTPGFLRAAAAGRQELAALGRAGASAGAPVLLQTADRSVIRPWWDRRMTGADCVLDVRATRRAVTALSPTPRVIAYAGGLHDVHRSPEPVRSRAIGDLVEWLGELDLG